MCVDDFNNSSFTTQLVTKIIDNLQVTIENIHIRYEDKISHSDGRMFSVGVTLEGLSAVSADSDWIETFLTNPAAMIHKLVSLKRLVAYWNANDPTSYCGLDLDLFITNFRNMIISRSEDDDASMSYLLKPITGTGKIVLYKKFVEDQPKTSVNLSFDQWALVLDDQQYFDLVSLVNFMVLSTRAARVIKFFHYHFLTCLASRIKASKVCYGS